VVSPKREISVGSIELVALRIVSDVATNGPHVPPRGAVVGPSYCGIVVTMYLSGLRLGRAGLSALPDYQSMRKHTQVSTAVLSSTCARVGAHFHHQYLPPFPPYE